MTFSLSEVRVLFEKIRYERMQSYFEVFVIKKAKKFLTEILFPRYLISRLSSNSEIRKLKYPAKINSLTVTDKLIRVQLNLLLYFEASF